MPSSSNQTQSQAQTPAQVQVAQTAERTFSNPYFSPSNSASSVAQRTPGMDMPAAGMPAVDMPVATFSDANRPQVAMPGQLVSSNASVVRSEPSPTTAPISQSNVPALDGYCPVTLMNSEAWVRGLEKFAIRHRGKVYLLSSQQAADEFMAAPDSFTPVLSGFDPLVFLREGRLVEGSIYDGVLRLDSLVFIFSSDENKEYFRINHKRLLEELEAAVSQAK